MLEQAGVAFTAIPPELDEAQAKASHSQPGRLAAALAKAKALAVSRRFDGDWVIGSDSVVSVGGRLFDKPSGRDEAQAHLAFFSGKTMELTSAVAIARNGATDWSHCDTARLTVRPLSERFIADYLDAEWPQVGYCVGVFRLEGRGVQLFDSIASVGKS